MNERNMNVFLYHSKTKLMCQELIEISTSLIMDKQM